MGEHSEKKEREREKDRAERRNIESMSRFFRITEKLSKQRFLKLTTIFMFLLVFAFTTAIIVVFLTTGGMEPSALVAGFFDFVKWEFAGLSLIKVSENLGLTKPNGSKLNEVVEDGASILDDTAEMMRDISDLTNPNSIIADEDEVG